MPMAEDVATFAGYVARIGQYVLSDVAPEVKHMNAGKLICQSICACRPSAKARSIQAAFPYTYAITPASPIRSEPPANGADVAVIEVL